MVSNFFAVKDSATFSRFCGRWDLDVTTDKAGLSGFNEKSDVWSNDDWCLHSGVEDDESKKMDCAIHDASFVDELADQLADHYVAVVQDQPCKHHLYPRGPGAAVFAVNSRHETAELNLNAIFKLAAYLGHYVVEDMAF